MKKTNEPAKSMIHYPHTFDVPASSAVKSVLEFESVLCSPPRRESASARSRRAAPSYSASSIT
eukprot:scaffold4097_cov151-Isochrysis_galbana.AAC.1